MRARQPLALAAAGAAGERAAALIAASPEFAGARRVALFASLPDEIPTRSLFERVVASGKQCVLPRVDVERGLRFARVERWEALEPGSFGALAPPADATPCEFSAGDLVVVPGLAFDAMGGRLGRGGGYYDRAFPPGEDPVPILFGLAYAVQLVDAVPVEPHDRRVEAVVTEAGLVRVEVSAERNEGARR
jgi:5-formyltetrahydrofolate cyclo-ligase